MEFNLENNEAALVIGLNEEQDGFNMKVIAHEEDEDLLPINCQVIYAIAELLSYDDEFLETVMKAADKVFPEPTIH